MRSETQAFARAAEDERRAGALESAVARASVMEGLFGDDAGPRVGRYRLRRLIGSGAHGQVFIAEDPELAREVAIKLVESEPGAEAEALARLSHPHVVRVFDLGVSDGQAFIVMELVGGRDLSRVLREDAPSVAVVRRLFAQAGAGLAAAHAVGLVHRDFKPSNVLLTKRGDAKVADFGLARTETPTTSPASPDGTSVAGTRAYMAPEQHAGRRVDAQADQYAFCVALWEALDGALPFAGSTTEAVHEAKLAGPPARDPARSTRALANVLRRGLSPDAGDRFPTMKALLVELTRGRPRWRSRVALAVVASAAVAVVAVALRDDCEAASLEFAPDRIASSFAATGLAAGPPQADRVAAKLERYVSAWSDARRTACGSHSAALTCLDHAATEFRTVVTDFERADAGTVGAAWFAVAGLPAPEACLDEAEPEDPPSAAELAVQRRLAQARAKQRTGRVDEALAESEVALRDAADLPARTRLEACFRLGRVFAAADQPRQSAETLSTCFFDAREADHAALAAASATHVANAAIALHDPAEAEVWLRHAEADLQRAGDPPGYRAPWLITTGNHAALQARHADAVAAFTEALALIGDDPLRASAVLSNRGDVYRSLGRLEESEADLRRALEMKATELPPGDPQLFAVTTNLALTLQARGDFAGAQVMLESAYEMATEASGPGSSRATRALVNLGNLAFERDDFLAAADYNERALRGRQAKEGDGSLAVPMLNLANALLALERREEAIVHYREVLQIFGHTLGADHPNNAYALTGLGAALTELGRADEAVDVLRRAVEIREQTHASLDHLTESRDFLDKALESAKRE